MAKNKGWIKVDRRILDNWIYESDEFDNFHAFMDLLLTASFEEHETKVKSGVIKSKPGQVITSLASLADRWGWSKNKVRRFLGTLAGTGVVHVDGTADGTAVTLVNWAKYQGTRHADGYDDEHADGYADGYADGTLQKNGKNGKNGKEGAQARARESGRSVVKPNQFNTGIQEWKDIDWDEFARQNDAIGSY